MSIINSTPSHDGYYMPAEYEKHDGTIMIWPVRPGSCLVKQQRQKECLRK